MHSLSRGVMLKCEYDYNNNKNNKNSNNIPYNNNNNIKLHDNGKRLFSYEDFWRLVDATCLICSSKLVPPPSLLLASTTTPPDFTIIDIYGHKVTPFSGITLVVVQILNPGNLEDKVEPSFGTDDAECFGYSIDEGMD
uniref:Uncharacterized protein n=1 Tax=Glossina pallidipes TaxID=7398 RepID=A0A1B0AK48_GLOPL